MKQNGLIYIQFLLLLGSISHCHQVIGQAIYFTRDGHIDFYSSTPVEDIKAINRKVNSVIDISTGKIEFSVLIIAFEFEKALMQEHFNEKFMESSKYPKATFKGILINNDKINYTDEGEYPAKATGELTIHGVTKAIEVEGTISVEKGSIKADAVFKLVPGDFNITIPAVVRDNIAKEIQVTLNASYKPYDDAKKN